MSADRDEVRNILADLFRSDLSFVKAEDLAGLMTSWLWTRVEGENDTRKAVAILVAVSSHLGHPGGSKDDIAPYLWSHQKATGRRWWSFSISYTDKAVADASKWYREKAWQLSRLENEDRFYRNLIAASGQSHEDPP